MSGGGKGGRQDSQTEMPAWMQTHYQDVIGRANQVADMPYAPYTGPEVAAFNPMQMAAMNNSINAASAYGLGAPAHAGVGMPEPQTYANGMQGYGSFPLFQQAVNDLNTVAPNWMNSYNQLYPVGDTPTYYNPLQVMPTDQPVAALPPGYNTGGGFMIDGGNLGLMELV